jgi:zinc transport system substrate-binding protein
MKAGRVVIRPVAAAATLLVLGAASACADGSSADPAPDGVRIVAAFYPLQFLAEQVGGRHAAVTGLTPPGAEPHDLELRARQVAAIADADVVLYLSGFQPAVDAAVTQQAGPAAFDVATLVPLLDLGAQAHHHDEAAGTPEPGGERDPHVWLDPDRLGTTGDALADRLGTVDPPNAADYTAAATELRQRLDELDAAYTGGLASCQRREMVVSHTAFGYLADRYHLEQIAVSGLSPEAEPTPQRIAEVIAEVRAHGATTIFFEPLVSSDIADLVAAETGIRTAVLDPIEGPPAGGGDYFSVMRDNLTALTTALGCA